MARNVGLCALVLLQLLFVCQCYREAPWRGRKLELPSRALSNAGNHTKVLRSYLVHRDSLETGSNKTASERFLEAVKRSHGRVTQLERNLQLMSGGVQTQAVAGSLETPVSAGSGEFVMQFSLGTPPQKFSTIVDTGSDLCWVQCSPCTGCFKQPDALFNPKASSSYSQTTCTDPLCKALPRPLCTINTCTYSYGYGDGSITQGDLAFDAVTLGSLAVPHVGFGCGRDNLGTFAGADGIIGLGQGPLSLPSQLTPAVAKIFSYCLVDRSSTVATSSPIIFGNAAASANAKYTPLVANAKNPTFYYVGVTGITIGGKALTIPASAFQIASDGSGGVIIDSGTTLTSWRKEAFTPILAAFRQQITFPEVNKIPSGLTLCYDVSGVPASSVTFPAMEVLMTNVNYAIPPQNLFVAADNSANTFCLAMGAADKFSIIGNIQQQNTLVVHDGVNHRVGFLPTQCAT